MIVRCRLDGASMPARLELLKRGKRRPQFVLLLNDGSGRRFAVGRVEAAVGYEILEGSPEELSALTLARFRLRRAGRERDPWRRLAAVLRACRRQGQRAARRSKNPHPEAARGTAATPSLKAQAPRHPHSSKHHPGPAKGHARAGAPRQHA